MTGRHGRLWRVLVAAVAIPAALVAGCGGDESSSGGGGGGSSTLKIGELATLTGGGAVYAAIGTKGTKLAIDDINAAGGIKAGDKTIKLEYTGADDKSDPTAAVTAAQKLINSEGVKYMTGSYGSATTAAYLPVVQNRDDFVTMLAGAAQESFTQQKVVYRPRITLSQYTTASAAYIADQGTKKLALLTDKQHSGEVEQTPKLKQDLASKGVDVAAEESYKLGDTDFGGQLSAILRTNPDAIYIRGFPVEAGLAIKQAREQGFSGPIYTNCGITAKVVKDTQVSDKDLQGVVDFYTLLPSDQVSLGVGDKATVEKFIADFKAKNGGEEPTDIAASAYDSVKILAAAIAKAGGADDPAAVRSALDELKVSDVDGLVQAYKPQDGDAIFAERQAYFDVAARKWFGGKKGFAAFEAI